MELSLQQPNPSQAADTSDVGEVAALPESPASVQALRTSFIVNDQKQLGRGRHGKSSHNKRGANYRPANVSALINSPVIPDFIYRLADVAEITGLTSQYILNVITRHDVITPQKTLDEKNHESYALTAREVGKLLKIKMLTDQGRPIREAADMVRHDSVFVEAGQKFFKEMIEWKDRPDRDSEVWGNLVEAITMIPTLNEPEKEALLQVEGLGESLVDTAAKLKLDSIRALISLLDGAYEKVGRAIFYLLLQPGLEGLRN